MDSNYNAAISYILWKRVHWSCPVVLLIIQKKSNKYQEPVEPCWFSFCYNEASSWIIQIKDVSGWMDFEKWYFNLVWKIQEELKHFLYWKDFIWLINRRFNIPWFWLNLGFVTYYLALCLFKQIGDTGELRTGWIYSWLKGVISLLHIKHSVGCSRLWVWRLATRNF